MIRLGAISVDTTSGSFSFTNCRFLFNEAADHGRKQNRCRPLLLLFFFFSFLQTFLFRVCVRFCDLWWLACEYDRNAEHVCVQSRSSHIDGQRRSHHDTLSSKIETKKEEEADENEKEEQQQQEDKATQADVCLFVVVGSENHRFVLCV